MQQKTLIALGAMAIIAVLAFFSMRAPEKGEHVGPRERPIAALKADDIKEIEITSGAAGKDHVVLKKADSGWRITVPGDYAADQQSVKSATEQLEKVAFGDLVTEKKEKAADLEVTDDKGVRVARGGGKVLFDAIIGKSVAGFTMVRPAGKDQVWQSTGIYKYTYAKDVKTWRDHNVFDFKADDVSRLAVEAAGQKLVLDKLPAATPDAKDAKAKPAANDTHWKVAETTVKVDPLDDSVANQMVQSMSSLRAADFDDNDKPADVGLTTPRYRITATVKGQPITLLVGNVKGDDSWLSVDGKPQIYLFRKTMIERLSQKPADFRDKTLVKAKADDLTEIEITRGADSMTLTKDGTAWKATKGVKGDVDETKLKPVVSAFDDFKGVTFAETTDPATTGLGKPMGTVVLHLRDNSTVTIKVGNESADKSEYFVQRVGSPDVVMAKHYAVDRFLKKPSDVAKTAAAAK